MLSYFIHTYGKGNRLCILPTVCTIRKYINEGICKVPKGGVLSGNIWRVHIYPEFGCHAMNLRICKYIYIHISPKGFVLKMIVYTTSWTDRNSDTGIALIIIILCYYCLFIWDQHGYHMTLNSFAMLWKKKKPNECHETLLNQNQNYI